MSPLGRVSLTTFAGLLGLIVGAALSVFAVIIGCWLIVLLNDDPSIGGLVSYLGGFAALAFGIYGGLYGMAYSLKLFRSMMSQLEPTEFQVTHDDSPWVDDDF
ncbi:MAG: hypothetical protein KDA86_10085 [Planctomycetaceae bacterium]|nr:hypothetical protein [Planctomycetaceae bacterium]MCA9111836.1 hypothetical protein [Planctomycetaceae bacterium]